MGLFRMGPTGNDATLLASFAAFNQISLTLENYHLQKYWSEPIACFELERLVESGNHISTASTLFRSTISVRVRKTGQQLNSWRYFQFFGRRLSDE